MDRNDVRYTTSPRPSVALRKESVDRNVVVALLAVGRAGSLSARRAWIEITTRTKIVIGCVSLSARRAWIEIETLSSVVSCPLVALRKESVDRNDTVQIVIVVVHASLSARRAWIEIPPVDTSSVNVSGRSPQGERG